MSVYVERWGDPQNTTMGDIHRYTTHLYFIVSCIMYTADTTTSALAMMSQSFLVLVLQASLVSRAILPSTPSQRYQQLM